MKKHRILRGQSPEKPADGHREKIIDRLDPKRQALFAEFGGKVHWPNAEKWNDGDA